MTETAHFAATLAVYDRCAVKSTNYGPTNPRFIIYQVIRLTETQGIMTPATVADSAREPAHATRYCRRTGRVIGLIAERHVEPVTAEIVEQNKRADVDYWCRYGAENDILRLAPEQQAQIHGIVKSALGETPLSEMGSLIDSLTAKVMMLPAEARVALFDKVLDLRIETIQGDRHAA